MLLGHRGLGRLGRQGRRAGKRAAREGRVRRRDDRGAGRRGRAGRRRDPGERPGQDHAGAPGEDGGEKDPEEKDGKAAAGAPHVLITRTPDGRLTFLQAMASRRKAALAAGLPAAFTGYLITDGYTGYQHLLSQLASIQQCAAHVIRRCRAVTKLGPGGVQNWAGDIITILRDAHQAVEAARARGDTTLDQQILDDLSERYDTAVTSGIIHNRLRDWHEREPPRLRPRHLAARLQGTGLPVHPRLRRQLDEQCQRTRRQSRETPSGRLRLLAFPGHPRPLVPPAQLPRLSRHPRHHRTRRHQQRHRRKSLATATPRRLDL